MAENKIKIEVKNLCKTFQNANAETEVLKDVSFHVYQNEFLVILGPGQCGKTVLLNIMADIEEATAGEVCFHDEKNVGFVFQRYALFHWKNVIDNVAAPLKYKGIDKKTRRKTAQNYIELVGLKGFEKSYPAQLSGGMKQRVGIARAYTGGNDVILMDEPFGALDAQTRYQMQNELLKIRNTEKTTVVFVTNNIEEAIYLGDRILLFSDKPSGIVKEYVPDLQRPRIQTSSEFMALRNEITDKMDLVL